MTRTPPKGTKGAGGLPYHVCHPTFERPDAEEAYGAESEAGDATGLPHMPDEVTRDLARRMHYAGWRAARARTDATRAHWLRAYRLLRDRVVLGNRKLIFRAVRRWSPPAAMADDMAGDCQVVLIQAVAAYNPWLGVRFSTYAFTCLMRALSRLSQRQASDRLWRSMPLEALPDGGPSDRAGGEASASPLAGIDEYLREGNDLLSTREKRVLTRRFRLDDGARTGTLEEVGREMGLSKERVRQVQASALDKLRGVLLGGGAGNSPRGI
ncbi:MAG: sigma-70 family RNA polymerase sigma factor [Gemmataceae bacterium]